jgi:hypothetical protein
MIASSPKIFDLHHPTASSVSNDKLFFILPIPNSVVYIFSIFLISLFNYQCTIFCSNIQFPRHF